MASRPNIPPGHVRPGSHRNRPRGPAEATPQAKSPYLAFTYAGAALTMKKREPRRRATAHPATPHPRRGHRMLPERPPGYTNPAEIKFAHKTEPILQCPRACALDRFVNPSIPKGP